MTQFLLGPVYFFGRVLLLL